MQSPDQSPAKITCSNTIIDKDSITITIGMINGSYKGKMIGSEIKGSWNQSGQSFPLDLKPGTGDVKAPNRPQTPKPPYSYNSEDVIYHNTDRTIQYGATITSPKGKGPFPALVLITGSGQQNRDEELMDHKPFAVLADYLTQRGFVVLRVDDRGMGQSTGDVKNATSADFAKDVNVSLDYLRSRKEVNKHKIGMLGHSEGGMIAQIVAAERKDIDFIIFFASPGVKIEDLMTKQVQMTSLSMGADSDIVNKYTQFYSSVVHSINQHNDPSLNKKIVTDNLNEWMNKTDPNVVTAMTGISDSNTKHKFIANFTSQLSSPWFQYFLRYDPAPFLQKINCKVLALDGDKDIQVDSKMNLEGIRMGLLKSMSSSYEIQELPGLNHLFQKCTACTIAEYATIEETIDPTALYAIGTWLDKHVK